MTREEEAVEKLWAAFEQDFGVWPILCDALEEAGQEALAEAVREKASQGHGPVRWMGQGSWDWWDVSLRSSGVVGGEWLSTEDFLRLGADQVGRVAGRSYGGYQPAFREYDSWREAWEALAPETKGARPAAPGEK